MANEVWNISALWARIVECSPDISGKGNKLENIAIKPTDDFQEILGICLAVGQRIVIEAQVRPNTGIEVYPHEIVCAIDGVTWNNVMVDAGDYRDKTIFFQVVNTD